MDTLRWNNGAGDRTVDDCAAKLQFFVEHDAFAEYDRVGEALRDKPYEFNAELVTAMNRAMMARSSRSAWEPFLDRDLAVLAAIPGEPDLITSSDLEYSNIRPGLHAYYLEMSAHKWLTDMAASKMLFLKRPRLVAISDSYLREALGIQSPDVRKHPWKAPYCAERALRVSDAMRAVGRDNISLLDTPQVTAPVEVSMVRILDILIWADMAIHSGHRVWNNAFPRSR